jgi:hypothetical protein
MNKAAATRAVTPKAAANLAGPADFKIAKNRSTHALQVGENGAKEHGVHSVIFAC